VYICAALSTTQSPTARNNKELREKKLKIFFCQIFNENNSMSEHRAAAKGKNVTERRERGFSIINLLLPLLFLLLSQLQMTAIPNYSYCIHFYVFFFVAVFIWRSGMVDIALKRRRGEKVRPCSSSNIYETEIS